MTEAALDGGAVPEGAVLLGQEEDVSRRVGAGGEAGGVEQHEGEKGVRLWLVARGMLDEELEKTDGFLAKLGPHEHFALRGFVAFVEEEVERLQDGI